MRPRALSSAHHNAFSGSCHVFRGLLGDDETRSARLAVDDRRHDGRVGHAQAFDPTDTQGAIHHRVTGLPHAAGADRVEDRVGRSPDERSQVVRRGAGCGRVDGVTPKPGIGPRPQRLASAPLSSARGRRSRRSRFDDRRRPWIGRPQPDHPRLGPSTYTVRVTNGSTASDHDRHKTVYPAVRPELVRGPLTLSMARGPPGPPKRDLG